MALENSRGLFFASLVLLCSGFAAVVVGRFFFLERYRLYGCNADYEEYSEHLRICDPTMPAADTSTAACLTVGASLLILAAVYPLARVAVRGRKEETDEALAHMQLAESLAHHPLLPDHRDRQKVQETILSILEEGREGGGGGGGASRLLRRRKEERATSLKRKLWIRRFASCFGVRLYLAIRDGSWALATTLVVLVLVAAATTVTTATAAATAAEAGKEETTVWWTGRLATASLALSAFLLPSQTVLVLFFAAFAADVTAASAAVAGFLVSTASVAFLQAMACVLWHSREAVERTVAFELRQRGFAPASLRLEYAVRAIVALF